MIADALQRFHLEKLFPIHHESFGTDLKVPIAPHFKLRRTMQEKYETERMAIPYEENWEDATGEYTKASESSLSTESLRLLNLPESPARGDELLIIHLIKSKLSNSVVPLKVVDLGGMYGLSWVRVAKYFEKEIQVKRLEMIVTNLKFDPSTHTENQRTIHGENVPLMSDEDFIFWNENKHLVSYLNCRVVDLPDNIDLIYENNSVTYHSLTPSLHRLAMLSKLNHGGSLITKDIRHAKSSPHDNHNNKIDLDNIVNADIQGFNQALQKSISFKSERSIAIEGQDCSLTNSAQIITKVG